jgi:hypothetical protein
LNRLIVSAIHLSNVGDSQNVQTLIEAPGSMSLMTASAGSAASGVGAADSAAVLADGLASVLGAALGALLGAVLGVWPAQAEITNNTPSSNPRWRFNFVSIAPPWCLLSFRCFCV